MSKVLSFVYGVTSYLVFFAVFVYFIAFVSGDFFGYYFDMPLPKTIDSPAGEGGASALMMNALLLMLFGVQHSVMARAGFKRWWTKIVPSQIERSTYVLASTAVLALVLWAWQPVATVVWAVENPTAQMALYVLGASGWVLILISTFLTNHFDLFGLRQVWLHLIGRPVTPVKFTSRLFYKFIRHPMMLGILVAFWSTPYMTTGHLVLSVVWTAYVLIGIKLEEHGLRHELGDDYRRYQETTPMLIPGMGGRKH